MDAGPSIQGLGSKASDQESWIQSLRSRALDPRLWNQEPSRFPGVYPVTPVSRTWVVNKTRNIKVRRTGYFLVPDFGATAHMIQGQSLEACFADVVHTDLTEEPTEELQISGYVMLSRARYPEKLWILRAFSSKLFAQGSPAGPSILLRKLLGEISPEQAQIEMMQAQCTKSTREAKGKSKKKKEELYCCAYCLLSKGENYMKPAHAFGAKTPEEVIELIMRFGAWTQCLKCQATFGNPDDRATSRMRRVTSKGKAERLCPHCCTYQPSTFFRKDQEYCQACQHLTCAGCEKSLHPSCFSKSSRNHYFSHGERVRCEECQAQKKEIRTEGKTSTCKTCKDTKPLARFRLHQKHRKDICMDCERIVCVGCKTSKPNEDFEPTIMAHYWRRAYYPAICICCKSRGATAKDPDLYTCTSYCGAELGTRHFDRTQLEHYKYHGRKSLVCTECRKLEKKRFDEISKKMKLKGAWKCTCGYRLNHGEKCDLFPPDRWPGGPKVSKKDYDWWLAHDHYRKP